MKTGFSLPFLKYFKNAGVKSPPCTCVNRVELNRSDESQCKEKVPELALLGRLELGGRIESPAAHLQNADTYPTTRSGSRTVS